MSPLVISWGYLKDNLRISEGYLGGILGISAWITWPERPKGAKYKVQLDITSSSLIGNKQCCMQINVFPSRKLLDLSAMRIVSGHVWLPWMVLVDRHNAAPMIASTGCIKKNDT